MVMGEFFLSLALSAAEARSEKRGVTGQRAAFHQGPRASGSASGRALALTALKPDMSITSSGLAGSVSGQGRENRETYRRTRCRYLRKLK